MAKVGIYEASPLSAADEAAPLPVSIESVAAGSGLATSAKQDTGNVSAAAIQATAGATNGAAVVTDASGTLQQYLRGLIKLLIGGAASSLSTTPVKGAGAISKPTPGNNISGVLLAANAARKSAVIANAHATATLYISPATPATANDFPVPAGQSFTDDVTAGVWYGICPTAAADVRVIEVA